MKITTKKTTKITTAITWRHTLCDDKCVAFAVMNGTLDAAAPFGSASLSVLNRALFQAHETEARAAYAEFKALVEKAAEDTAGIVQVKEE